MSRETTQLIADVKSAARALQSHHYIWMVDAAVKHFRERIEHGEREIMRHQHFQDEPLVNRFEDVEDVLAGRSAREREIDKNRSFLDQNRAIVRFLVLAQRLLSQVSAEQFAASIDWSSFGRRDPAAQRTITIDKKARTL